MQTYLLIIAIVLHLIALVAGLTGKKRTGTLFFIAASHIPIMIFTKEWIHSGQAPLSSMHHVMIALSACLLPVYTAIVWGRGLYWTKTYFPIAGIAPLAAAAFVFKSEAVWHLAPALQSPWFVPHVISYMISYAMAFVAFILLITSLFKKSEDDARILTEGSYELLSLAIPLMTFGMMSGALWANGIWGRYWSWDQKETWSLITWFLYLIYFHCRKSGKLRKYENMVQALAFAALLTTFVLVNILPKLASKMHSYV